MTDSRVARSIRLECGPCDLRSTENCAAPPRPALRPGGSRYHRSARRPALRGAATRPGVERSRAAGHRHRLVALGPAPIHVLLALPGTAGLRPVARLHVDLRLPGREGPGCRAGARAPPRHPPEHSGTGIHAGLDPCPRDVVPTQQHRPRARRRDHDLHGAGLEHDVQLLPLLALRARRPERGRGGLSLLVVAASQMAGAAVRHTGAGLEQHVEHGRWLVFPDDQ